eukprot:104423_1
MKLFVNLLLCSILIGAVLSDPSQCSNQIMAAFDPDNTGCSTQNQDCFQFDSTGFYLTNNITYLGFYVNVDGHCCYQYKSVWTGNMDCDGKQRSQMFWQLGLECPISSSNTFNVMSGGDLLLHSKTCYEGVTFDDSPCGPNSADCFHEVCIENDCNGECPVGDGFFLVKSGPAFAFGCITTPYCICPPTNDPTSDPTSDPTADPTTDPTTDPTSDPTADPT